MSFNMTRFSLFLLAIMISVITSSCSDSSTSTNPTNAKLMVVHASPDAPGVDIAVPEANVNVVELYSVGPDCVKVPVTVKFVD
jgi:hypothetical protein